MGNPAFALTEEDDPVTDGYKLFTFEEGAIIVTDNALLKSQLSGNEKWFLFRTVAQVGIFVSKDLEASIMKQGLPVNVCRYVGEKHVQPV